MMSLTSAVLITGCSSGFGLETARLFLDKGWHVVATMRTPRADVLPASDRLRVLALEVTDADSIRRCVEQAGPIDALVNNAGIGLLAPLEGIAMTSAREVFETNVLGTIAMTQAVLPQLRERRAGVVVNVTSSVTLKPLPLLSVYTGSKAAVNAFTESLALELAPFSVRARLVLPGRAPGTSFGDNARRLVEGSAHAAYAEFTQHVFAAVRDSNSPVTHAQDVAEAVWRAVTDPAAPMRIPAGADSVALSGA
jgi:NAD(P)-dependent dehydrogenase (short-subunit alcohol dehydrogenase family)